MHSLLDAVAIFFSPLNASANALYAHFTKMACSPNGVFAMAGIVVASVALAVFCACWTLVAGRRASAQRDNLKFALHRSHLALRLRDTLIHSFPEAVVVLPANGRDMLRYHGGQRLLQFCLAGPDAKKFAAAIDALLMRGSTFSLMTRTSATHAISVSGQLIGDHAVVFLRQGGAETKDISGTISRCASPRAISVSRKRAHSNQAARERIEPRMVA